MKWITHEKVNEDRGECRWLIPSHKSSNLHESEQHFAREIPCNGGQLTHYEGAPLFRVGFNTSVQD